jgi:cytochrome c553
MICGATSPNERFVNHATNGKERHSSKCPRYHGSGMATCSRCHGSGTEITLAVIATKRPRSHDRGEIECPRCVGSGNA